jgi:hypothetical protein
MSSRRARPDDDDLLDDDDDDLLDSNPRNPHASASRWRHQESSSFRGAAKENQERHDHSSHAVAREAEARGRVNDLADFLNSSRISPNEVQHEQRGSTPNTPRFKPIMAASADLQKAAGGSRPGSALPPAQQGPPPDGKDIAVGPLLNYRRMEGHKWFGSVLVVVKGGGKTQPFEPTLVLQPARSEDQHAQNGGYTGNSNGTSLSKGRAEVKGVCLYSDPRNTFWRFDVAVDVQEVEARWEYTLPGLRFASKTKPQRNVFHVPARSESFRIMFHSCNGFSVGTDEDAWSGPALWNDVLRRHAEVPFHVM